MSSFAGQTEAGDITDFAATVLSTALTGYLAGTNVALADTDTVLNGFSKLQGQVSARVSMSGYTANAFLFAAGSVAAGSSAFTYESASKSMVLPNTAGVANGKIRLWGSDVGFNTPILGYSTGYTPPSAFYSFAYTNLTASGGTIPSGVWSNTLNLSGYTSGSSIWGVFFNLYGVDGGNLSGELVGGSFNCGHGNTVAMTFNSVVGIEGRAALGGTMTTAIGVRALARAGLNGDTGTVTHAIAIDVAVTQHNGNTTSLTNAYGIRLASWNKGTSAAWTNTYGIYADASIDIGSSLKYFIYSLSTSPSRFSGNLSVVLSNAATIGLGVTLASGHSVDALQILTNAGNDAFVIDKNGQPAVKVNTAPADADIDPNQLFWYFDSSNGAAKAKFKGKSADGTVVQGELALT